MTPDKQKKLKEHLEAIAKILYEDFDWNKYCADMIKANLGRKKEN